jgi:hypothetical protein
MEYGKNAGKKFQPLKKGEYSKTVIQVMNPVRASSWTEDRNLAGSIRYLALQYKQAL